MQKYMPIIGMYQNGNFKASLFRGNLTSFVLYMLYLGIYIFFITINRIMDIRWFYSQLL